MILTKPVRATQGTGIELLLRRGPPRRTAPRHRTVLLRVRTAPVDVHAAVMWCLSGPTRGSEYTSEVRNMRMASVEARTAAVEELFVALEAVIQSYRSLPDDERNER